MKNMSKKQTAVQYAEEIIKIILYNIDSDELERIQEVFDEAIQMEKEQIKQANIVGVNCGLYKYKNSEQYYNKTYKKKKYE